MIDLGREEVLANGELLACAEVDSRLQWCDSSDLALTAIDETWDWQKRLRSENMVK